MFIKTTTNNFTITNKNGQKTWVKKSRKTYSEFLNLKKFPFFSILVFGWPLNKVKKYRFITNDNQLKMRQTFPRRKNGKNIERSCQISQNIVCLLSIKALCILFKIFGSLLWKKDHFGILRVCNFLVDFYSLLQIFEKNPAIVFSCLFRSRKY